MQCTRIVKLKHTHTWLEGIKLTNIIGPLYHSTTKKRIIKQMLCLWIVKSIKSFKIPESLLYLLKDSIFIKIESLYWIVEIFDLYMKYGIKIEYLYWIGFVVSSSTRGSFVNLYYDPHNPQFVNSVQCTRIIELKHTHLIWRN